MLRKPPWLPPKSIGFLPSRVGCETKSSFARRQSQEHAAERVAVAVVEVERGVGGHRDDVALAELGGKVPGCEALNLRAAPMAGRSSTRQNAAGHGGGGRGHHIGRHIGAVAHEVGELLSLRRERGSLTLGAREGGGDAMTARGAEVPTCKDQGRTSKGRDKGNQLFRVRVW